MDAELSPSHAPGGESGQMVLDALQAARGLGGSVGGDTSSHHVRGISEFSQVQHSIN